ncbi:hypothetical protein EYR38_004726 [Pleurotus pulmonarius]|nr:hypothetical protein EYR38_004726 [Pleurotus pulmonarius]
MDPLSITAAIVSFIDTAKRIKDYVDKIGQNRQILKELMEDVVEELTELQNLCQDRETRLNHLDYDSTWSLRKLQSTMKSKAKYFAFEIGSPLFIGVLTIFFLYELSGPRTDFLSPPPNTAQYSIGWKVLDHTSNDAIEYQFLHLQVQRAVTLLRHISATYTFTTEETRGAEYFPYESDIPETLPPGTLMRSATIEALQILQLLEFEPAMLCLWEGAHHLMQLSNCLNKLALKDDAVAILTWLTTIYQTLMQRKSNTYLPYVTWGLWRLANLRYGTSEGLDTIRYAVDICREMTATSQVEHSSDLVTSLCHCSSHLLENGYFEDAVACTEEALAIQRKAPALQDDPNCPSVFWEASGDMHIAHSPSRTICRSYEMAVEEGVCLAMRTLSLVFAGRWSEGLIIATEAINCFDALIKCSRSRSYEGWRMRMQSEKYENIASNIWSPDAPLVAAISDADDLDHEEIPGEAGLCVGLVDTNVIGQAY